MVLIVLDGLDASGKSTQAIGLYSSLKISGKTAYLRIHPSDDNLFGTKTRQFLYSSGKNAHLASSIFYMLDIIRSILLYSWRKYDYVVFVRYLMGTAYLPSPLDKIAYYLFALTVPTSEFMFFLDVNPEEADRRIHQTRNQLEMFESLDELKKIRRKALSLVLAGNWRIIDANRSTKDIQKEILGALRLPYQELEL